MLRFVLTLTGLALLSQVHHATAQTGAVKNKGLDEFFSAVYRSSSGPSPSNDLVGKDLPRNNLSRRSLSPNDLSPNDLSPNDLSPNDLLRTSCEKIMREDMRTMSLLDMNVDRVMHRSGKMRLQLRSIYTQGSALYFLLRMQNRSSLDYDVATIRFFIAEPANRKTPLVKYGELKPLYVYDSSSIVRGYGKAANVVVLPRFILPYGKKLVIEVLEKNSGRQLQLQVTNFMLEKARIL